MTPQQADGLEAMLMAWSREPYRCRDQRRPRRSLIVVALLPLRGPRVQRPPRRRPRNGHASLAQRAGHRSLAGIGADVGRGLGTGRTVA